jgi:hypothetical protein
VPHARPGRHGTRCPGHDETPASCAPGRRFVTIATMTTTTINPSTTSITSATSTTDDNRFPAPDGPTAPWFARHVRLMATLSGITWTALGLESILRPVQHNYRDTLVNLPWALTLFTIIGIHQIQRPHGGRLERWGYIGVVATMSYGLLALVPQLCGDVATGFTVVAPIWILAMVVFGIGTARAGVFPRWVGVGLGLSELLTIAAAAAMSPWVPIRDRGSFSGAVAHGLVLLAVSFAVERPHGRLARKLS